MSDETVFVINPTAIRKSQRNRVDKDGTPCVTVRVPRSSFYPEQLVTVDITRCRCSCTTLANEDHLCDHMRVVGVFGPVMAE